MGKILLLAPIILTVLVSACVQGSIVENFAFNGGGGQCASRESDAQMTVRGNLIEFSGYAATSVPCYDLSASYSIEETKEENMPTTQVITIEIEAEDQGGVCIECVGEVPFSGSIRINGEQWSGGGNYKIRIVYEGQELASVYNYFT